MNTELYEAQQARLTELMEEYKQSNGDEQSFEIWKRAKAVSLGLPEESSIIEIYQLQKDLWRESDAIKLGLPAETSYEELAGILSITMAHVDELLKKMWRDVIMFAVPIDKSYEAPEAITSVIREHVDYNLIGEIMQRRKERIDEIKFLYKMLPKSQSYDLFQLFHVYNPTLSPFHNTVENLQYDNTNKITK